MRPSAISTPSAPTSSKKSSNANTAEEPELSHETHRRIMEDDHHPPEFKRVQQNIAAAAMLVRCLSEASTPEAKNLHKEMRVLLDCAAAKQAESSTQRRDGTLAGNQAPPPQEASVHHTLRHDAVRIPVQARVSEMCDICHTLDAR